MRRYLAGAAFGVVATLVLTGTAVAATGGTFVLGRTNSASSQTLLTSTAATGPILALSVSRAGQTPLAVSPSAGKATHLDADELDGLDSTALQRRVSGRCVSGQAVTGVSVTGAVACASTQDAPVLLRAVAMSGGKGTALCPAGTLPIAGGVFPSIGSGLAALVYSGGFVSAQQSGWAGYAVPIEGSGYDGTGTVTVSCSSNAQLPAGSSSLRMPSAP